MTRIKRILQNKVFLGIFCLLVSGGICFVLTPFYNEAIAGLKEVVRLKADVPFGEEITEAMLEVVEVGAFNLPPDIATAPSQVLGTYAAKELSKGDYLTPAKLLQEPVKGNEYLYTLKEGEMAISFSVRGFEYGLSDKLIAGDIVTLASKDDRVTIMPIELTYMRVLAVTTGNGADVTDGKKEYASGYNTDELHTAAVTVAAVPEQARLIAALNGTGIHCALYYRGGDIQSLLDEQAAVIADIRDGTLLGTVLTSEQEKSFSSVDMYSVDDAQAFANDAVEELQAQYAD